MNKDKISKPYHRKKRRALELFSMDTPFRPKIIPDKRKIYRRKKRIEPDDVSDND